MRRARNFKHFGSKQRLLHCMARTSRRANALIKIRTVSVGGNASYRVSNCYHCYTCMFIPTKNAKHLKSSIVIFYLVGMPSINVISRFVGNVESTIAFDIFENELDDSTRDIDVRYLCNLKGLCFS